MCYRVREQGVDQLVLLCSFVTTALLHPLTSGTPCPAACWCLEETACEHELEAHVARTF